MPKIIELIIEVLFSIITIEISILGIGVAIYSVFSYRFEKLIYKDFKNHQIKPWAKGAFYALFIILPLVSGSIIGTIRTFDIKNPEIRLLNYETIMLIDDIKGAIICIFKFIGIIIGLVIVVYFIYLIICFFIETFRITYNKVKEKTNTFVAVIISIIVTCAIPFIIYDLLRLFVE